MTQMVPVTTMLNEISRIGQERDMAEARAAVLRAGLDQVNATVRDALQELSRRPELEP